MPIDVGAAIILLADLALIGIFTVHPLRRGFDDSDKGWGNVVRLPRPQHASGKRAATFVVITVLVSVAIIGLRNPDLEHLYRRSVAALAGSVVKDPSVVAGYANSLVPIVPVSVIAFLAAEAVALPASPGRRLMILLHGPLALAMAMLTDTLLLFVGLGLGVPVGPYPVVSILGHYAVVYALAMRLAVTNYQLPRPTQTLLLRRGNFVDNLLTIAALVVGILIVAATGVFFVHLGGNDPIVFAFVVVAIPAYLKCSLLAAFSLLHLFGEKPPNPTDERPPIDVLAPSYNEERNIVAWVQAIDVAAGVYGGPVRIFLCDDGSTDATKTLARAAMARCTWATGEVLECPHGGKSVAMNIGLARGSAEFVIRHDTDCLVHPEAFLYTVPWLQQRPEVGIVGAFLLPKMPFTTWIDRMRALEIGTGFGLPRLAFSSVDSQPCVPGNYTAFRRQGAMAIGGYVDGMNGEDIDFTCNMTRIGYRAAYDRRIWAYEDVPDNTRELLMQRRRWNIGSINNFARFIPLASGSSGPRFWFAEFVHAARRLVMPVQFAAFLFGLQVVFFNPSPRTNLAHLLAFYVIAKFPLIALTVASMAYRGIARTLWWWPLYYGFAILKRIANIQAILSLPARSVAMPWRRPGAPEVVEWPGLQPLLLAELPGSAERGGDQ